MKSQKIPFRFEILRNSDKFEILKIPFLLEGCETADIYRNYVKLLYWTRQDHYRGTTENLKYRFGKINVNKKSCLQYEILINNKRLAFFFS